jgi:hypothetical protein
MFLGVYGARPVTSGLRTLRRVRPDQLERRFRERLDALGPASRAELLPSSSFQTPSAQLGSVSSLGSPRR